MKTLQIFASVCSSISSIIAFALLLIRPIRDKLLGVADNCNAMKCLLRSEMLKTYYKHREDKIIRQYELENFIFCYKSYKQHKGNSFIDKVYKEVMEWEVVY